jgi:hypothetical protein
MKRQIPENSNLPWPIKPLHRIIIKIKIQFQVSKTIRPVVIITDISIVSDVFITQYY